MKIDGKNVSRFPDWYKSIPIIIQNFGKTPAYDVTSSMYFNPHQYPLEIEIPYTELGTTASKSVIAPGDRVHMTINLPVDLAQAEIDDITEGQSAIYITGKIVYFDAFKKRHTTNICLYSNGSNFSKRLFAWYHEGNYEEED